jgi:hypothetical protein
LAEVLSSGSQDFSQELQQIPVIFDIGIGPMLGFRQTKHFHRGDLPMRVEVPKERNGTSNTNLQGG